MDTPTPEFWKKCTTCKKPIAFDSRYWVCSVSTCNRQRTGLTFCSVTCFDVHLPVMNHKDAGAIEKRAPHLKAWQREQHAAANPEPRPAPSSSVSTNKPSPSHTASPSIPSSRQNSDDEILVVVSKVKSYIRERSGMNTSDSVMDLLSRKIRVWSDDAIRRAGQAERKTVLDRDFPPSR